MTKKHLPSPELLRKLLRYEPLTGKLFWKARMPDMFEDGKQKTVDKCSAWNARNAGKEALTANFIGYKQGSVMGVKCLAHRVIWAVATGLWPARYIDHINGKRSDNRLNNLRDVSSIENSRNQRINKKNTSGHMGVSFKDRRKKWEAYIKVESKHIHLGSFTLKNDAIAARTAAEMEYNFHENHGRKT